MESIRLATSVGILAITLPLHLDSKCLVVLLHLFALLTQTQVFSCDLPDSRKAAFRYTSETRQDASQRK